MVVGGNFSLLRLAKLSIERQVSHPIAEKTHPGAYIKHLGSDGWVVTRLSERVDESQYNWGTERKLRITMIRPCTCDSGELGQRTNMNVCIIPVITQSMDPFLVHT